MFKEPWKLPGKFLSFLWWLFFSKGPQAAAADSDAPSEESQRAGHEVTDANAKTMIIFAGCLFGAIFITMGALGWMYTHLYTPAKAMPVTPLQASFEHGPRTKTSIAKDWERLNAQASQHLTGYGWADRSQGVVHIPITQAMELVGKEGLPARAGQTPYFPPPDQEKLPLSELETNVNANSYDPSQ